MNLLARDLQEGLGGDGRTILEWILKKQVSTFNWIDSAQDKDYWRALVDAALNLESLSKLI